MLSVNVASLAGLALWFSRHDWERAMVRKMLDPFSILLLHFFSTLLNAALCDRIAYHPALPYIHVHTLSKLLTPVVMTCT